MHTSQIMVLHPYIYPVLHVNCISTQLGENAFLETGDGGACEGFDAWTVLAAGGPLVLGACGAPGQGSLSVSPVSCLSGIGSSLPDLP